jgi:2-oxoglutarate dehydrogenase E2 component (dihydrolipoamide succinyltransferase)
MPHADILSPWEQEGTKSVVRAWLVEPGRAVRRDEPIVELETDKVAVEVASPADGILVEILLHPGADAPPGSLLGRLDLSKDSEAGPKSVRKSTSASVVPNSNNMQFPSEMRISPSVRRLLREKGLDPRTISGTGRGGRLTFEDVSNAPARRMNESQAEIAKGGAASVVSGKIPHTNMRKRIASHMAQSLRDSPHVTAVFEADFSAIRAHRESQKAIYEARGISLTYTAYFIAACAQAMKAAPAVNSRWHENELEIFEDVNIGVGISLGEGGLIVPVVHRAQTLALEDIAARLHDVTSRGRAGKLAPSDVQGGTFSISNHGVSGSLLAAPIIINQPQSAILGVGKLEKRVIVRDVDGTDSLQIRPMAYVTLSIDHRVLDGHQTNAWLTRFVEVLETWPSNL